MEARNKEFWGERMDSSGGGPEKLEVHERSLRPAVDLVIMMMMETK